VIVERLLVSGSHFASEEWSPASPTEDDDEAFVRTKRHGSDEVLARPIKVGREQDVARTAVG